VPVSIPWPKRHRGYHLEGGDKKISKTGFGFKRRTEKFLEGLIPHLVCAIADINNAILVALDGDMKRIAQGHGVGSGKYLKLGLIKLSCFEPDAAARVRAAMTLIEHEWDTTAGQAGRRIFIEISDKSFR
jgi:hypothetical protein